MNRQEIHESLVHISKSLKRLFNISTTISIVDQSDRKFSGISIYPSYQCVDRIVNDILTGNKMDNVIEHWLHSDDWVIEIDSKLLVKRETMFNGAELALLLIYQIDRVIFNYTLPQRVTEIIRVTLADLDYRNNAVARSSVCRDLYTIPFMIASGFVNYKQQLPPESIISIAGRKAIQLYQRVWTSILTTFGMVEQMNRSDEELYATIQYSLNWIFEAVNDMKYSTRTLRLNLQRFTTAIDSNYIKQIMKKIFLRFTKVGNSIAALESLKTITPKMEAMQEKMLDEHWKGVYKAITEGQELVGEFIDSKGFVKKVDNKEIDIIALQIENIETVDDKIYLIERVYKFLSIVNYSLSLLDDSNMAKRVRVSRTTLERQQSELEELRQRIKSVKVSPKRYGIYIKYPVGYEG